MIGDRQLGPHSPPLVVAELSGNHNGSLDRALAIVDAVAGAGAHAIKLQTYTADSMTLDVEEPAFRIDDPSSLWHGYSLHQLYRQAATPWEWHEPIFERARQRGLICFSSPFDAVAVEFLERLGAPCFKIASFENVDLPLVRCAARTGKPLIISTGMATAVELDETVEAARGAGADQLVLLKCTSTYPASPEHSNLATLPDLATRFGVAVGLSDHTLGIGVAVAAVAMGAVMIEKHVTLSRRDGGVDSAFSLEPHELAQLVTESRRAWQSIGAVHYGPTAGEQPSRQFRRSLYIAADVRAGDVLTENNLRSVRPGFGLPPKHYDELLGKTVRRAARKGTPVTWDLVDIPRKPDSSG